MKAEQFVRPMTKTIFDYFKISFNWDCDKDKDLTFKLFELLKIDYTKFITDTRLFDGMKEHRIYDQNVHLLRSPTSSARRNGVLEYFTIEMSGQACREFELRGGNWKELINFIMSVNHKALCIHLTKDDYNGCVSFEELKEKIEKREFSSCFRRSSKVPTGSNVRIETSGTSVYKEAERRYYGFTSDLSATLDENNEISIDIIKKEGWSATFGNRNGCQLQIYDKKVERLVNVNSVVPYQSWVRYEMRFGSLKAEALLILVYDALKNDSLDSLASGILYQLLDFKEVKYEDYKNISHNETWDKWLMFLGLSSEEDKIPVNPHLDYEPTLKRSIQWFEHSVGKTMLKIFALDDGATLNYLMAHAMAQKLIKGKFDNRVMSEVNNYLMYSGDEEPKDHLMTLKLLYARLKDYADEEISLEELINKSVDIKKYVNTDDEDDEDFYDPFFYTNDEDLPF